MFFPEFYSVWGVLFKVCRVFLGFWDASGHHFGGIFVTLSIPGLPWVHFGTTLGNFGRPGCEKGCNMGFGRRKAHPIFTILGTIS